jgi:hypothetical protein
LNILHVDSQEKKDGETIYHAKDFQAQEDLPSEWKDNYNHELYMLKDAQDRAQYELAVRHGEGHQVPELRDLS